LNFITKKKGVPILPKDEIEYIAEASIYGTIAKLHDNLV
jgi:hypothetical protein